MEELIGMSIVLIIILIFLAKGLRDIRKEKEEKNNDLY